MRIAVDKAAVKAGESSDHAQPIAILSDDGQEIAKLGRGKHKVASDASAVWVHYDPDGFELASGQTVRVWVEVSPS